MLIAANVNTHSYFNESTTYINTVLIDNCSTNNLPSSFVHLGVRLGRSFHVELSDRLAVRSTRVADPKDNSGLVAVEFPVDLADGAWHQVAVAVQTGSHVTLYVDCHVIATQRWRYRSWSVDLPIDEDTEDSVVTIGKSFIENSRYPQYEVRSDSPESGVEFIRILHCCYQQY